MPHRAQTSVSLGSTLRTNKKKKKNVSFPMLCYRHFGRSCYSSNIFSLALSFSLSLSRFLSFFFLLISKKKKSPLPARQLFLHFQFTPPSSPCPSPLPPPTEPRDKGKKRKKHTCSFSKSCLWFVTSPTCPIKLFVIQRTISIHCSDHTNAQKRKTNVMPFLDLLPLMRMTTVDWLSRSRRPSPGY